MGNAHKIPVNVYGFHSMVLGISAERLTGTAIFAIISLVLFRFNIMISFLVLLFGIGTAFYHRNDQYLLSRMLHSIAWKLTRKQFSYHPVYNAEGINELFILEGKRIGLAVRLLTEEIYNLGEKDAKSTIHLLEESLNSTTSDMSIFTLWSVPGRTESEIKYPDLRRLKNYAELKQAAISSARSFDIYIIINREVANVEADKRHLLKDLETISFAVARAGYGIERNVNREVVERISSVFL